MLIWSNWKGIVFKDFNRKSLDFNISVILLTFACMLVSFSSVVMSNACQSINLLRNPSKQLNSTFLFTPTRAFYILSRGSLRICNGNPRLRKSHINSINLNSKIIFHRKLLQIGLLFISATSICNIVQIMSRHWIFRLQSCSIHIILIGSIFTHSTRGIKQLFATYFVLHDFTEQTS